MLTGRDNQILRSLGIFGFLNTRQIEALHFEGSQSAVMARRRMRAIEGAGMVVSWRPDVYSSKVYHLSSKGADYISGLLGESYSMVKRSNKTDHYLAVADIYVSMVKEIVSFELEPDLQVRGRSSYRPDLVATVRLSPDRGRVVIFEADLGEETITYFIKEKLGRLEGAYRAGALLSQYKTIPLLVVVTVSEQRADNLRKAIERSIREPIGYLVVTFETDLIEKVRGYNG